MKQHYGETKAQKQAEWLAKFTEALITLHPRLSGRIEWDAAKHYYFSGFSIEDAVFQYCLARNIT